MRLNSPSISAHATSDVEAVLVATPGANANGILRRSRASESMLALRPPVLAALARIRVAAAGHPDGFAGLDGAGRDAVLRTVEADAPDAFDALLVQSYTGYYSHIAVQRALGLPSPLQPIGYPAMMQAAFDERRLDRVRATAKPWRSA